MKINYYLAFLILGMSINAFSQNSYWLGQEVNLKNLETRKDSFHMIQNNKVVGYWIWETQMNDKEIIFKDVSVLTDLVNEEFILKLDRQKLNTTNIDMILSTSKNKLKVDLSRTTSKDLKANYNLNGNSKIIDSTFAKNVILRPAIFGLLHTILDYKSLDESIETFFLSSGKFATMQLKYIGEEEVMVATGKFSTYKLSFEGKNQLSNIIYIKKEFPRRIVKVELIGQPLTIELVN